MEILRTDGHVMNAPAFSMRRPKPIVVKQEWEEYTIKLNAQLYVIGITGSFSKLIKYRYNRWKISKLHIPTRDPNNYIDIILMVSKSHPWVLLTLD